MTAALAPEINASQALRLASGGAGVLDVRDPYEWIAGHAPIAEHIPLPTLPGARTPDWRGRPVLVLCRSGNRAKSAAVLLRHRGIEAFAVSGGMNAWRDAGGLVVTDGGAPGVVA
jgi:rhodanese-related sulfurtransferase